VAVLACVALILLSASSRAEDHPKILVLLEQTEPSFLVRLRAELGSSGFAVAVVRPSTFPPNRQEVEQLAQQEGATVGLSLIESGAGIEIWITDPVSAKTTFREVLLGLYDPREAPGVIAIRVVETLRATLIEVEHSHTGGSETTLHSAPELKSSTNAGPSRFTLGVASGSAYSSGGVGAMLNVELSLEWAVSSRFNVAVNGALTPARKKLRGPEGEASVTWYLTGLSLGFWATDPTAPFRLRAGAGGWLALMSLTGQAVTPYVNTRADFVSVIPHLDVGLRYSLTRRLGLDLGLSGGLSAPGASIQFAGREVATWGRPLWVGNLALEAGLD